MRRSREEGRDGSGEAKREVKMERKKPVGKGDGERVQGEVRVCERAGWERRDIFLEKSEGIVYIEISDGMVFPSLIFHATSPGLPRGGSHILEILHIPAQQLVTRIVAKLADRRGEETQTEEEKKLEETKESVKPEEKKPEVR
ncbi:hypothetical protein Sjap_001200 [Stephania japonica]|uniref:Uncharacterized protein n=1 Tax=Stephania japonica TaxID=461633 RepID=A0AAP0KM20_9MAGN